MGWLLEEDEDKPSKWKIEDNPNIAAGRNAPGAVRGALSVLNGPTLGFGDELSGIVGGAIDKLKGKPGSFAEAYKANRDYARGAQDFEKEANPWTTGITQAAAGLPLALIGAPASVASGVLPMALNAAKTGAIYGGLSGAGNSTADDMAGVARDAAMGGAQGAATAGVLTPVAAGIGAGARNVGTRFIESMAARHAQEKIAEALARDARGNVFTSGAADPTGQVLARMNKLPPEAALFDAGGKNTNQLLDTLATLPGRTKEAVSQAQHQRTATIGDRLRQAADEALGAGGRRLSTTVEQLDRQRSTAAKPLYDALKDVGVTVDDGLATLLARTRGTHGEAQNLYRFQTGQDINLGALKPGDKVPFTVLDTLKQSLDDAGSAAKNAGNGKMGLAIDNARIALLEKLDSVAPQHAGQSIYKLARDAYAGPSKLMDAAQQGRLAIAKDEASISEMVRGMTSGERDAFRIGAFEGLRAKLGTQSGQTNILNMWKEPATREKLQVIFGSERAFREFASETAKESLMKKLQGVGTGSQTASRMAGMGDLDAAAVGEAASAIGNAKAGNVLGAVGAAKNAWNRVATPQTVRDQMGQMLLSQGPAARQNVQQMQRLIESLNRSNGLLSSDIGYTGGIIGSGLLNP